MIRKIILIVGSAFTMSGAMAASAGDTFPNYHFEAEITDQPSLQRGAKLFMNYCSGCHSLELQRYNRTFKDLGIDPEIGSENLIFTGAKEVERMHNSLSAADGSKWFGKAPPDLSVTARAKGGDYIYNYLQGFYVDDSRPLGFNNTVFPGASMPNPLWQLQGLQKPVIEEHEHCNGAGECETNTKIVGFEKLTEGALNDLGYQRVASDLTNFLVYVSDPSALQRLAMGPWVLLFLALLTVLFYFLKREFWRDIH